MVSMAPSLEKLANAKVLSAPASVEASPASDESTGGSAYDGDWTSVAESFHIADATPCEPKDVSRVPPAVTFGTQMLAMFSAAPSVLKETSADKGAVG